MNSLHEFPLQDLLSEFAEPAFIIRSNAPRFSLLASNYEQGSTFAGSVATLHESGLVDVFSILGTSQAGHAVLEAGLYECLKTGRIVWLSGFQFFNPGQIFTTDDPLFWQLELRPVCTSPGNIDFLLITSHLMSESKTSSHVSTDKQPAAQSTPIDLIDPGHSQRLRDEKLREAMVIQTELNQALRIEIASLRRQIQTQPESSAIDTLLLQQQNKLEIKSKLEAQALAVENESIRDFFMQAPLSFAVLGGPEFIIELINERYSLFLPQRPLLGLTLKVALPGLVDSPILETIQKVYRTGEPFKAKDVLFAAVNPENGLTEDRYANMYFKARRNKQDLIDGIFVFGIDVTDTIKAKLKLEDSERRYSSILNALPHIAWTISSDVVINFVNQHWFDYSGIILNKADYWGWEEAVFPDDYVEAKAKHRKIIESGIQGEFELRYRRADGEYRWHLCRIQPVYDNLGVIEFFIGTATDIEELKRLQEQKDDFVNIASHELKTPLTSLKLSIQLVTERAENLEPKMVSGLMLRATKSLDKIVSLVDDLLNAGKLTQGQLHLYKTVFSPVSIITEYCNELLQTGNFKVQFTGDTSLTVLADIKRIEQVLINFLNNATKYAPESKSIQFDIRKKGDKIKIAISDFGPGIRPELIPNLFDRYYRVENRTYQDSGLGLGLFICAEIIYKHGGEINVESKMGLGSTFWFTLSAAD